MKSAYFFLREQGAKPWPGAQALMRWQRGSVTCSLAVGVPVGSRGAVVPGRRIPSCRAKDVIDVWYVVQVAAGRETNAEAMIRRFVDDGVLQECFVPRYELMKSFRGEWRLCTAKLFPGYVIVVTDDIDALEAELRKVPAFTKLLASGDAFLPLSPEEIDWIAAFTEHGDRVIEMSEGIIEGDQVRITKGPLRHHEAWIKKINRHKRLAYLEIEMFGRTLEAKVGLGIVKKTS